MAPDLAVTSKELVDELEHKILTGKYAVGEMLPSERRLSEAYSVSRSGVREALKILGERGLVTVRHGRGTFVTDPNAGAAGAAIGNALRRERITARDVIIGRMAVEKESAALAAEARTEADLDLLDRIIEGMETSLAILDRVRADLAFHLALVKASHNPVFEAMFRAISGFTAEMMLRSLSDRAVAEVGVPQHRAILEAVRQRDAGEARRLVEEHMAVAIERYGPDLERSLDTVAERELQRVLGPTGSLEDIWRVADRE